MSRDKLAPFEQLQALDLRIEDLSRQAAESPARIAELEGRANQARAAADLERGRLAENERARRQQEQVLGEEKEKVKKWESRLPALKHPREFAALQREVESAKKANAAAEEELTRLREEAATIRANLTLKETERDSRIAEVERQLPDLRRAEAGHREQIAALEADRAKARQAADPKLLGTYDQVRRRRPGRVVVEAINGSCTGCHRRISPQIVNRLLAGAVEQCPACQRLIYIKAEAPAPE